MRLKHLKEFRTLFSSHNFCFENREENGCFERFWRPMFGYCVSLTWVAYIFTVCWTALSGKSCSAEVINALLEAASLWSMALGVLGVSVVRGMPKKPETDSKPDTDINQQHKI